MDTPNLPENEIEEITWQDDENRATLFLRSVFVVLSGALILSVLRYQSSSQPVALIIETIILTVGLPCLIIWLFFGQGLRPVEWLSDQKYNAWNYGTDFRIGKECFRWLIPLLLLGVVEAIIFKLFFGAFLISKGNVTIWIIATLILWLLGFCLTWFIWGYLWFGCAQGFGAVAATIAVIVLTGFAFRQSIYPRNMAILASVCFISLALLCGYICWKFKSWIPILYAVILLAPIASWILLY